MTDTVIVTHIEDWVILSGPNGGKFAKIKPEDAIRLANDLFDQSEKALRGTGRLHKYD